MAASESSPAAPQVAVKKASLQPVAATSHDIPFPDAESAVEQQLLQFANQSRQQAGAPPLTLDPGLSQAALIHAQAMLNARELSHQFQGEPSLPQRLAATTDLQLDQEGENVALDYDAEHGHQHLMLSPPHRANLLNPAYNVVGLGVVRMETACTSCRTSARRFRGRMGHIVPVRHPRKERACHQTSWAS